MPLHEKVFCTHLMCSGLCKIMLEEIPFLSEHVGLFRRSRHVEISEPVKLLLVNKIYESKLVYKMGFRCALSFAGDIWMGLAIMIGCQRRRGGFTSRDGQFNHTPFPSSSPAADPG